MMNCCSACIHKKKEILYEQTPQDGSFTVFIMFCSQFCLYTTRLYGHATENKLTSYKSSVAEHNCLTEWPTKILKKLTVGQTFFTSTTYGRQNVKRFSIKIKNRYAVTIVEFYISFCSQIYLESLSMHHTV